MPEELSFDSVEMLEEFLSAPSPEDILDLRQLRGSIMILGAGGKMGPTLAMRARRAFTAGGMPGEIIAVSRFTENGVMEKLYRMGIRTIRCDLLDPDALHDLPVTDNLIFMAGRKFGSTGDEPLTWAMNCWLPGMIAQKFNGSRIVALSTGNVYPMTPVQTGGATETDPPGPVGEYAQSCLGRERMIQYWCGRNGTPAVIIRLNYAIDLRYGVLLDVARKVFTCETIDLSMGHVNVIWQGDANSVILRSLRHCGRPPLILNLAGLETISIRHLAVEFGLRFGREPRFAGAEAGTALLSNASRMATLIGPPGTSLRRMIDWTADWLKSGCPTYEKPTHFEEREGRF